MQKIGGETDAFVHKQSGAWAALGVDVAGAIPMLPAVYPAHAVESDGPASGPAQLTEEWPVHLSLAGYWPVEAHSL